MSNVAAAAEILGKASPIAVAAIEAIRRDPEAAKLVQERKGKNDGFRRSRIAARLYKRAMRRGDEVEAKMHLLAYIRDMDPDVLEAVGKFQEAMDMLASVLPDEDDED